MIQKLRRVRALVLHRTSVRERDRVVDVFSREEGRLTVLAAGVRRITSRRLGHLEPLLESELFLSHTPRQESVREARALSMFPTLRGSLPRLRLAYPIVRLLREHIPERLPDARLYDAVRMLFGELDQPSTPVNLLFLRSAEVHLLRHLGLLPDLSACGRCRRPLEADVFTFDRSRGGFACVSCLLREAALGAKRDLPAVPAAASYVSLTGAVKILRLLLEEPAPRRGLRVPPGVLKTVADLTQSFLPAFAERHPSILSSGSRGRFTLG